MTDESDHDDDRVIEGHGPRAVDLSRQPGISKWRNRREGVDGDGDEGQPASGHPLWRGSIGKRTSLHSSRFQPGAGGPLEADRLNLPTADLQADGVEWLNWLEMRHSRFARCVMPTASAISKRFS
jgi:hypothetical protein